MRALLVWMAIFGFAVYAQAGPLSKPLDTTKDVVKKVVPEVYDVSIHLKSGEIVKINKLGMTPWGVKHRLSFNSLDKTLRVIPADSDEDKKIRVIKTADIEKIEAVPVRENDKNPGPETVPAPKPVSACKCNPCKCKDCKCGQ